MLLQYKPTNAHSCATFTIILQKKEMLHVSALTGPSSGSTINCIKRVRCIQFIVLADDGLIRVETRSS